MHICIIYSFKSERSNTFVRFLLHEGCEFVLKEKRYRKDKLLKGKLLPGSGEVCVTNGKITLYLGTSGSQYNRKLWVFSRIQKGKWA